MSTMPTVSTAELPSDEPPIGNEKAKSVPTLSNGQRVWRALLPGVIGGSLGFLLSGFNPRVAAVLAGSPYIHQGADTVLKKAGGSLERDVSKPEGMTNPQKVWKVVRPGLSTASSGLVTGALLGVPSPVQFALIGAGIHYAVKYGAKGYQALRSMMTRENSSESVPSTTIDDRTKPSSRDTAVKPSSLDVVVSRELAA